MNRTLLSIALTPAFPFPGYDPAIGGRLGDGVNVNDTAYNARPLRFEYWRAGDSAMHALDSRKWVGAGAESNAGRAQPSARAGGRQPGAVKRDAVPDASRRLSCGRCW